MILPIVKFGHPVLRQKGATIDHLTPEIRQLVTDMFDTMYAAHGIGLAAQQVGKALRLTVVDVRGIEDRPSTLSFGGEPADVDGAMPMVLINPEVTPLGGPVPGPEGCLSFPEIFAEVVRAESIEVKASGLDGRTTVFRCSGLLAKAIQHEVDHLNGILFIDRMTSEAKQPLEEELAALMAETKAALRAEARKASGQGRPAA